MMQAMIFAAGLGTRLKPITDTKPKALVEVGGEPLLRRVIMNLKNSGASKIVINVHHFSEQIIDYLHVNNNFGMDIAVSDESEMLLDTGGGIKKASHFFSLDLPILIHNVDILSNVDLRKFYDGCNNADAMLLVSSRKTARYLLFDNDMRLVGWTNVQTGEVKSPYKDIDVHACRMLAFSGIHVISPSMFKLMESFPDKFGIMDFYLSVCARADIRGWQKDDLLLMDVGKLETLHDADAFVGNLNKD